MSKFLNSSLKLFRSRFLRKSGRRWESCENNNCDVCTETADTPKKPESHFIAQKILQLPLFTVAFVKKHYEVSPLIIIAFAGLFMNLSIAARTALTRDDVKWMTNGTFACEREPNFENPPRRKFFVINQKYKFSEGLRKALKEPEEEPPEDKKQKK